MDRKPNADFWFDLLGYNVVLSLLYISLFIENLINLLTQKLECFVLSVEFRNQIDRQFSLQIIERQPVLVESPE